MTTQPTNKRLKFFCDLAPLVVFFLAYKYAGIYMATVVLIIATTATTALTYYYERKISWMPIVTVILVALMGGLTLWSGNQLFIKMKPTVINGLFAAIVLGAMACDKLVLKQLFGHSLNMSDAAWKIFSLRWSGLFILLAFLNELIWRNSSTDIWVNFKVFGILPLMFLFMVTQYPFLKRHAIIPKANEQ